MKQVYTLLLLITCLTATAQTTRLDSVEQRLNKMDKVLEVLRCFRIFGTLQAQYQRADTAGIASAAGGDFAPQSNNRFMLRRGQLRIMFDYKHPKKGFRLVESAFMLDATEKGVIIKEAYGRVIDPAIGWIGLKGGIFMRPFSFEVNNPPLVRENPEFARMSQVLFPGEADLGAALVVESPGNFKPLYIRLDAGAFNGLGGTASEIDKRKDFIGRLQLRKSFGKEVKFTIGGGASYYYGGVLQSTKTAYTLKDNGQGILLYTAGDTLGLNKKYFKREYYGADLELQLDYKLGATILRGEFIAGTQPGTSASAGTPGALGSDLYIRRFNGAYFTLVQTFKHKIGGHPVYHDLVFRYDWYDPNSSLKGNQLAATTDARYGKADIKYQTFGLGYIFRPYEWVKLTLYYDIVKNESTALPGYGADLKDNVLTVRAQFMFDSNWFVKK